MNADGSNVRRVTNVIGYDGGPFFSPDGKRICWRRFSEDGARAEIYSAAIDGSDAKALTHLNAMSWAPFYHPTGDYLIFGTNIHGFANFELYVVDADGTKEPIRITTTDGFDSLPVFTPDGKQLSWTSTRGASSSSGSADRKGQIFIADWNDAAVRTALGLSASTASIAALNDSVSPALPDATSIAKSNATSTSQDFSAADIGRHVDYLCRPELGGRLTGTPGRKMRMLTWQRSWKTSA